MENLDEDIVIHPIKTKNEKSIPETGLILVNPVDFQYGLEIFRREGATKRFLHNSNLYVNKEEDFFLAGPAIGAPVAVMALEKLIALGATKVFFYGWCGAIDRSVTVSDLLIPTRAMSGEGTSRYYRDDMYPSPSMDMVGILRALAEKNSFITNDAYLWTTDAPYRESRKYLTGLNIQKNVTAVDMEFSALCCVATFRGIDFGAMMLVSDEIWAEKWSTGFSRKEFQIKSRKIMDILLHTEGLRESTK